MHMCSLSADESYYGAYGATREKEEKLTEDLDTWLGPVFKVPTKPQACLLSWSMKM